MKVKHRLRLCGSLPPEIAYVQSEWAICPMAD
jgi:hypothetical protein